MPKKGIAGTRKTTRPSQELAYWTCRGEGGGLIQATIKAMISMVILHALHPRRGAADQKVIKIEALVVQGHIF